MPNISKVADRAKLKPRREPYWLKTLSNCYLGFRRMTAGRTGNWIARHFDSASGKQAYKSLGNFSHLPEHQQFDAALKCAQEWFAHLGKGGSPGPVTVRDACERYLRHLQETRGECAAHDAGVRFQSYVLDDPGFAATELAKLTPRHMEQWRARLRQKPTASGPNKGGMRTDSSLNRDMTCFRAALNYAFQDGHVTSDFAWRTKLKPIAGADRKRDLYLAKAERERLQAHASEDLAQLLRLISMIPLRPGAAAALRVSDFDKTLGTLTIRHDKAGARRQIALPAEVAAFIASCCRGKLPSAPILCRSNGGTWNKDSWKGPFKEAAKSAGLPAAATCYAIRHSVITDLMNLGIDSMTVARLSGTSILMIEKHYGHLTNESARMALTRLCA